MKVLLLGANGQVGDALRRAQPPAVELVVATRTGRLDDASACETADLDDPGGLAALVGRVAPDAVVNAAAYTAVDRAEDEPDAARRANAEAPAALAAACAAQDAWLVHYSTDYVFDGSAARAYREDDPPRPLNVYGCSKLAGEAAVRGSGCRHLIFRTAWVYALDHGRNFPRTMLALAADRDELRVVADQTGAPTPASLIADVTWRILLAPRPARSGLWHLAAGGHTSWHGFAEAIFAEAVRNGWLDRAPRVVPISSSEYPTRARRPARSCLDTRRLQRDFGVELPDWRAALGAAFSGG